MIYTSHPKPRLRDKQIGDSVRLKGVDLNSAFFVAAILPDGYFLIVDTHGKDRFIASPGHEVINEQVLRRSV